ncbi:MAG TPA: hypothetical protein DDZ76_07855 [Xanthomonadales bacterium]|nr:hypothetical protein [Xanthomonadales bacterium]
MKTETWPESEGRRSSARIADAGSATSEYGQQPVFPLNTGKIRLGRATADEIRATIGITQKDIRMARSVMAKVAAAPKAARRKRAAKP